MSKQRKDLKIILLQVRDDMPTIVEERESFAKFARLKISQIDLLNVFETSYFSTDVINGYDALFIGGSSNVSVLESEKYNFLKPCFELIRHCVEIDFPVFASCFGHQLSVLALGGIVMRGDEKYIEMGTIPIQLTKNAQHDILFNDVPNNFLAISVHREYATNIPESCMLLAYTDLCIHSFKVVGKRFWTTQFHSEVDKEILMKRLSQYNRKYTDTDEELQVLFDSSRKTPESNELLDKFVNRVLLGRLK